MSSLRLFRIKFDRPDGTYAPGEVVSGHVILQLERAKKVRGLKICAKGIAKTHWTHTRKDPHDDKRTITDSYDGSEEYFSTSFNILVPTDGGAEVNLPVGQSLHPFAFQLPRNIPCSFEHHYGYIRYTVKAVIDRPWKFDHECKAAFTIITPLDLNTHLPQCVGVTEDIHKNFSCFCCINVGRLEATISFPSAGYVPGQKIHTKVFFENHSSNVDVTRVCVALGQNLKFRTSSPPDTQTSNSDMKKVAHSGPFAKREDLELILPVPPIPPSRLEYCGLIDLNYTLDVSIHVTGWHCSTQKRYPILIGTIPIRPSPTAPTIYEIEPAATVTTPFMDDPSPLMPSAPSPEENRAGNSRPPLPIGFNVASNRNIDWNMPPPSYEECMTRADSIKEKDDSSYVFGASQPFAPRYPVFNFPLPLHAPRK